MDKSKVDKTVFLPSMFIVAGMSLLLIMFPKKGEEFLRKIFSTITDKVGSVFLLFIFAVMIFIFWLAFSRYGSIKLGEGKPQFSTMSWVSMLFCASIGSSILYWGSIEWGYYYVAPPFGVKSCSTGAAEWASTYGLFHWGISAWATYCLVAIPVAYYFYVKKIPILRLSSACAGVIGEKRAKGVLGKIIDICVIFGMVGGIATSIALGTPMVAEGISRLLGIKPNFILNIVIILIWACIFGTSVFLGLEKGIKKLSDINIFMAIGILIFILIVGPTAFIMNTFTHSVGKMFQNFIQMSLNTDPIVKSGFPQAWTVFYWAWWIVYTPCVGLFIAKISKGRTIKEVILGSTVYGSLGCWIFFGILGNYSLSLQLNGIKDVVGILYKKGGPATIITILSTLPYCKIVISIFIVLAFISLATTLDSAAYTLSAVTTYNLKENQDPPRWYRLFWAFAITLVPLVLIFVGGLETLKIASILGSLPLIIIFCIIGVSFMRTLKEDYGEEVKVTKESTNSKINSEYVNKNKEMTVKLKMR